MQEERLGVGAYLKKCMHQGLEVFKHPMMLLPTLVLGAIWLVIGYLSSTTELPGWAKVVSFLSFAEGGLFGGALGAAGGIVGKVVVAVFINSAILPLFQKKLPFVGVAGGIKGMFSNMGEQVVCGIAPFLGGMGAALLLYSFMNISHVQINAFVGVAAVVLLLQNIGNQGGFLFGLHHHAYAHGHDRRFHRGGGPQHGRSQMEHLIRTPSPPPCPPPRPCPQQEKSRITFSLCLTKVHDDD